MAEGPFHEVVPGMGNAGDINEIDVCVKAICLLARPVLCNLYPDF